MVHARDQSTNERVRNARYILPVYTYMHHIRSLYICVRAHAFIYRRFRRANGPDARRHDKIVLAPNDTAIATREDSIYIRNFCSLTANTRSYIYHTRGELSVSGETCGCCLHSRTYFRFRGARIALTSVLIALRILNFLQMRKDRKTHRNIYARRLRTGDTAKKGV